MTLPHLAAIAAEFAAAGFALATIWREVRAARTRIAQIWRNRL